MTPTSTEHTHPPFDSIQVSEELIRIYEQSYGFTGMGEIMLQSGLWILDETQNGSSSKLN